MTKITAIQVDMDGVVANFDKLACNLTGTDTLTGVNKSFMWSQIAKYEQRGGEFWFDLEKMPDADELMTFLMKVSTEHGILIEFLTAAGNFKSAPGQKVRWADMHYKGIKPNIVIKSPEKAARFASPTVVLIDDRLKSIEPWLEAGGIGILHTSAKDTIEKLNKLLEKNPV